MKKVNWWDYLLQLFMVILGVFLGMWASNCNSNNLLEKNKRDLLIGIQSEMKTNLAYLKSRKEQDIQPFFNSLDSLSKALESNSDILEEPFEKEAFYTRIPNFPGLGRPKLDDAMFEAAKFSNLLSNLDIELLKQLSKVYTLQYNIQETGKVLLRQLYGIDSETKYGKVIDLMWDIMQDYFGAQYNLIKECEKALELLEKNTE